ncbi:MAG: methyltransferase domain-containing protein, partial [Patescibacteria group bacterium]
RWVSYWYQIDFVRRSKPVRVLEIGPGNKTVTDTLRKLGISVTTADIAPDLEPDVVASATALPFPDNAFDSVLAAEVLEHIPYSDVPKALSEISRVTKTYAVVSLPHAVYVFSFGFKVPTIRRLNFIVKIPFFWRRHRFNGEHHWELGKRRFSTRKVKNLMEDAGFIVGEQKRFFDDPAHIFFFLEKRYS